MGNMSGGQGTTNQGQESSGPPPWLKPGLQYAAQQAENIYGSGGPQYYQGSTVANPSQATQAGQQAAIGYGLNGNQASNAGSGYIQNVLGGKYFGVNPNAGSGGNQYLHQEIGGKYLAPGNPYQGAVDKSISDAIIPNVDAQFSLAGRYGSGAHQGTLGTSLANAIAPLHYSNYQNERGLQQAAALDQLNMGQAQYQNERGLQQSAAGLAPTYAGLQQGQIAALQGAGAQQDQLAQNQINANIQKWGYNQALPGQNLDALLSRLSNNAYGSTGFSSAAGQQQNNPNWLGLVGGLLGGIL